jgi:hypothetical protein
MTMIDLGQAYADYQEPTIAPEGVYDLRIANVKATDPKAGEPSNGDPKGWTVMIVFNEGNFKPMNHWIPNTGHPANDHWVDNAVKNLRGFVKLFDVPINGSDFNPEDLIGLEVNNAIVNVAENEYNGEVSNINTLKLPMV